MTIRSSGNSPLRNHHECLATVVMLFVMLLCGAISRAVPPAQVALPPLGRGVPTSHADVETKLKYRWNSDGPVVYRFEIDIDVADNTLKYRGRNTLKLVPGSPLAKAAASIAKQGTGSGFVVHPEGIIVTCAHCVHGATKVNAKIGGRNYAATVIGADFDQDIAVLRVEATGLPYTTFADSSTVRLSDEVRAIGFPLSDLLGESIKVTRGEVSGIGGPNGKRGLQIDATVNPGNSGGPLVDNTGRVVGVTSSLLAGAGISEVGFAIPSNDVATFVKTVKVPVAQAGQGARLEPADVVAQVSPACVFLEVEYGLGGFGIGELARLDSSAYWYELPDVRRGVLALAAPRHESSRGAMVVSQAGEIVDSVGDGMLPCLLGSAAAVGIEQLPTAAPGSATTSASVLMARPDPAQRAEPASPYGLRPSERSRLGSPWQRNQRTSPTSLKLIEGVESTTCTFTAPRRGLVDLTKTYELRVDGESPEAEPYLVVEGKGTGVFDQELGLMQSMDFRSTLVMNSNNVSVRIPVTMRFERMSADELAKEEEDRLARAKQREQELATRPPPSGQSGETANFSALTPATLSGPKNSVKSMSLSPRLDKFDPDN